MLKRLTHFRKPHPIAVGVILILSVCSVLWWAHDASTDAIDISQEHLYKAKVLEVLGEQQVIQSVSGKLGTEQTLKIEIEEKGKRYEIEALNDLTPVDEGTLVIVQGLLSSDDGNFYVVDIVRTRGLTVIAIAFAVLLVAIAGVHGIYALTGLIFSMSVIFNGIIPAILKGYDPVVVGLLGSLLILVVTLYVSHGFNRKSLAALVGIGLTLLVVGLTAQFAVSAMHFTGFSAEEAVYLNLEAGETINLVGLLVAGVIIAAIGILDDVAITQAATVFSLASVDPSLHGIALFRKAMSVGRDHISAVVNTLVLAYTGAALPLILLLTIRQFPLGFVINGEVVAEEIVRTLVSSAGLILAVPLTTLVAVYLVKNSSRKA